MKTTLISFYTGFFTLFYSVTVFAMNPFQPSVLAFYPTITAQLWLYEGTGVIKATNSKDGIVIITTNLGSKQSPIEKDITYAVQDSDLFETIVQGTSISYSYLHKSSYDVIVTIDN